MGVAVIEYELVHHRQKDLLREIECNRISASVIRTGSTWHGALLCNFSGRGVRMLVVCTPAGFETYFDRLSAGLPANPPAGQAMAVGLEISRQFAVVTFVRHAALRDI